MLTRASIGAAAVARAALARAGLARGGPIRAVLALAVLAGTGLGTAALAGLACGQAGPSPAAGHVRAAAMHLDPGATLCRVSRATGAGRPLLLALGASFTAGIGAPSPADGWAVRLAELLRWRAVALGVPGAGYTMPGLGHAGPMARELRELDLAALRPAVIVVQAGHDDWRVPPPVESRRVAAFVRQLRAAAPHARLAFLTVFSRPDPPRPVLARELTVDAAIVGAVRAADRHAVVIDPLRGRWQFPRSGGSVGLHPSARGHLLIAEHVALALAQAGVVPRAAARRSAAPWSSPAGVSCRRMSVPGAHGRPAAPHTEPPTAHAAQA